MFISALGSISGIENRLKLRRVKKACVVLVDGLGVENISYAGGHMPFLGRQSMNTIRCSFPSTTATSLVSFATGLAPGEHTFVGYQVQQHSQPLNLLTGLSPDEATMMQTKMTVSEMAVQADIPTYFIGPAEYETSGFTAASMPSAVYVAEKTVADRTQRARQLIKEQKSCLIYLYVPELDQTAHRYGSESRNWLEKAEEVDTELRRLSDELGTQAGLLVTADHGIVDVQPEDHIYLDDFDFDWSQVQSIGGDPRARFIYLKNSVDIDIVKNQLTELIGPAAFVCGLSDLIDAGWLTREVSAEAMALYPQLFVIAKTRIAIYHRAHSKPQSMKMIGQHGGWSDAETRIPLIRLNAFA